MKDTKKKLTSHRRKPIILEDGIKWFFGGLLGLGLIWVLIGIVAGFPYKTIALPILLGMLGMAYLMLMVVLVFCVYGIKLLLFALLKKFSVMLLGLNLMAWTAFVMLLIALFDDYERGEKSGPIYPLNLTGGHTGEVLVMLVRILAASVLILLLGLAIDYLKKQKK